MFLSHFSSGSSSSLKTRVSTRGNFGNSTGGVEKSPMITTAHSVRGGQQQQRYGGVRGDGRGRDGRNGRNKNLSKSYSGPYTLTHIFYIDEALDPLSC